MIPPFVTFLEQRLHKIFSEWLFKKKNAFEASVKFIVKTSIYSMGNRSRQRFLFLAGRKNLPQSDFFGGRKHFEDFGCLAEA